MRLNIFRQNHSVSKKFLRSIGFCDKCEEIIRDVVLTKKVWERIQEDSHL